MASFRFRLERVLRVREQLRRQAEDALAAARDAVARIDDAIAAACAAQEEARAAEAAERQYTGADLLHWRAYGEAARAREQTLRGDRAAALAVVEARRAELLARRSDERGLERLRERARERHDAGEANTERTLLDELALRGHEERER